MADDVRVPVDFTEEDERGDFCREVTPPVAEAFSLAEDRLPPKGPRPSMAAGALPTGTALSGPQRCQGDRSPDAQCGLDHYLVQVLAADAPLPDFDGVAATGGAGDICIFDLARPLESRMEADVAISVTLPRPALEKAAGLGSLHGIVLKAGWRMTPLIVAFIAGMCALGEPLPEMQALAVQDAAVALLSAALKDREPGENGGAAAVGDGLRQRVLQFVERNLCVLELSPDFLCRRFNVSRAHLYRAFAVEGGVAKVLREMRLDAAYRELVQAARLSRSITEIAYSLGFSSGNQLLRGFRLRFGMTPSEARASGGGDARGQDVDLQAYLARLSSKVTPD
ncbi:MAG: helix-turn-helix domain-containing protein [Rhodanobacter sp.]